MWLLFLAALLSPIWAAVNTTEVIAIQNQLNKHVAKLQILLDNVKILSTRVIALGRTNESLETDHLGVASQLGQNVSAQELRSYGPVIRPHKGEKEQTGGIIDQIMQKCVADAVIVGQQAEIVKLSRKSDELDVRVKKLEMEKEGKSSAYPNKTIDDVWSLIKQLTQQLEYIQVQPRPEIVKNANLKEENTILIMGGRKKNDSDYVGALVLSADRSQWIESPLKLPYNASGMCAVYLDGEIYLFGGLNIRYILYKLDKNLIWTQMHPMFPERQWITNSCLEWNGYIWVLGGTNLGDSLNIVDRYDPKENKWARITEMKYPRSRAAAVLWNDEIIISGGEINNSSRTNTVESFKLGHCMELMNMPKSYSGHSVVAYKNNIISMGGWLEKEQNDVFEFDPQEINGKWKTLPAMNNPAAYFPGIVLDEEIYAIGGWQGNGIGELDRVEIFNGNHWRTGPSLPYPANEMSAMIVPQKFANRLLPRHV